MGITKKVLEKEPHGQHWNQGRVLTLPGIFLSRTIDTIISKDGLSILVVARHTTHNIRKSPLSVPF